MNLYLNYFKNEICTPDDNPPIGIVLGAKKDELLMQSIDQIICETCPEDGRMSMKKYGSVGKINQQALGEIIWQMF